MSESATPERTAHEPMVRHRVSIPIPSRLHDRLTKVFGEIDVFLSADTLWVQPTRTRHLDFAFYAEPSAGGWRVGYRSAMEGVEAPKGANTAARALGTALNAADSEAPTFTRRLRAVLGTNSSADARTRAITMLRGHEGTPSNVSEALVALGNGDTIAALQWAEDASAEDLAASAGFSTCLAALRGDHVEARRCAPELDGSAESEPTLRFLHQALTELGDRRTAEAAAERMSAWMRREEAADLLAGIAVDKAGRGEREDAWAMALDAVKRAGRHTPAIVRAGRAFEGIGAFEEARALYERAASIDPDALPPQLALLRLDVWLGDEESARPRAERLREAYPDRVEPVRALAILACLRRDFDAATELLEEALTLQPGDPQTLLWRAELRMIHGAFRDSLADIEDSMLRTTRPADGILHALLAARSGDFEDVLPVLVLPSFRDNFHDGLFEYTLPAWIGQERIDRALAKPAVMEAEMQAVLTETSGNRSAAPTRVVERDGKRGLEKLPKVARAREQSAGALKLLRTGTVDDVFQRFTELRERFPESPHPHCYRGELWLWLGEYDEAIADFDRGLEHTPVRWGYVGKAATYILQNNIEAADEQLALCAQKFTPIPGATTHVYVGELRRCQERWDEAEYELKEGLRAKPHRHAAAMNLALTYLATGRAEEAEPIWRRVWRALPALLFRAGANLGIPAQERTSMKHIVPMVGEALKMMRGNRSSHLITYFVGDHMRVAPDGARWAQIAREAVDMEEERLLGDLLHSAMSR